MIRSHIYILIFTFFSIVFLSDSLPALDPSKEVHQFVRDSWQSRDGLPQNTVYDIIQTKDGYIWVATQDGLARFDGISFTVFDTPNAEIFKTSWIWSLYEDRSKNLWIGTHRGGLIRYQNGRFTNFTTKDGLLSNEIKCIYGDKSGRLFIGTYGEGLNIRENGEFAGFTTRDGLPSNRIRVVIEDSSSNIWIGTEDSGVSLFKNGKFTRPVSNELLSKSNVTAIIEDKKGNIWIATDGNGLFRIKGSSISHFSKKNGLPDERMSDIAEDSNGNLWISTFQGGIVKISDEKIVPMSIEENSDPLLSILEDREKNLWIGTNGGGLIQLRDGKITTFSTEDGLTHPMATALFESAERELFAGTWQGGLHLLENGKFKPFRFNSKEDVKTILSIFKDSRKRLWIGTKSAGLIMHDGTVSRSFGERDGLIYNKVLSILEDRNHILWFGTNRGLIKYDGNKFTNYTKKEGLPNNRIIALFEDSKGRLWIGTDGGGIAIFENNKVSLLGVEQGLSSNRIMSILEDSKERVWISTYGGGLNLFLNGKFHAFRQKDGLFDDEIYVVLQDANENLWMSCNKGIFMVPIKNIFGFLENKAEQIQSIPFNTKDGMKSVECNGGFQYSGIKRKDGTMIFPTNRGIVSIHPDKLKKNSYPPPVHIESVVADGRKIFRKNDIVFEPGTERLEFNYTGLTFTIPERTKFQYIIEGYDKKWHTVTDKRSAVYMNLGPGNFKFKVRAANSDGVWSKESALFNFTISPYFYETVWFRLVLFSLFGVALYIMFVVRFKKIKEKNRILEEKVKEVEQKYEKSRLDNERADMYIESLLDHMEKQKPYRKSTLTLMQLAEELSMSHLYLSQIINLKLNKTYYSFINSYRVEEAKEALADPERSDESILSIAFEAGFNSKTTFNKVFKNETGKTPSQYRKDLLL